MSEFVYDGVSYDDEQMAELIPAVLAFMADRVTAINTANGWFDEDRTFGDGIALIHSEVSEALEAFRDHGLEDRYRFSFTEDGYAYASPGSENYDMWTMQGAIPKPEGVASEFADVLVRLLDESHRQEIDLGTAFMLKTQYNATRGYRHGGKAL